jgi:DTW domain-containing protein YfiP
MSRDTCYRCFWPKPLCWCGSIVPMPTRTRFVFLMHPKEYKQEKAGTGRLTHLCLPNSEIQVGVEFDGHPRVQALLGDPANFPVLVYPGESARNLSNGELPAAELAGRRLVILLLDGTWSSARKMLKLSPSLQRLPRIMFTPSGPSRYVIKQQPQDGCLSTLEATHEVLLALARSGLDEYALPGQLHALFDRMQDFQIRCARDPSRPGYRRQPYSEPGARSPARSGSGLRRNRFFRAPAGRERA